MSDSNTSPAELFKSYGLCSKGSWFGASIAFDENGAGDMPLALCRALPKLGGVYLTFCRFLSWRADLLHPACIEVLQANVQNYPAIPLAAVAQTIQRQLGDAAGELRLSLEPSALWNTYNRTAYLSKHKGQAVVVEVPKTPVSAAEFAAFELAMQTVRHPDVSAVVSPVVLQQFHQWLRNSESLSHERTYLDALAPHRSEMLAAYPIPIAELSTPSILCWPVVEGRSVAELIRKGNADATVQIASAILEQYYSLSIIDADPDPEAMVIDQYNQLHFRRLNNPVAMPPNRINDAVKYTSAVLANNATVSAQTLIRLVLAHPPLDREKRLMDEFSGVEPELKIHRWFPSSASAFESNWRALARMESARPLFLDCMMRNLVAIGYWNSDAVRAGARRVDAISEAQSPVVKRMLRTQAGLLLNKQSAYEWTLGSGLLMFSAMKEMNRLFEEVRENDLTVGVEDTIEPKHPVRPNRLSHAILLGVLLTILLTSVLLGGTAPEPWPLLLRILAVGTLPAMFWAVWKMG